jgi:NADH pyrophosphatase NudC (nudix superfamily)
MSEEFRFCPRCASPLLRAVHGEYERLACPDNTCGFVHWDNPVPVVAAIVEHEGHIILARNALWREGIFALITGFLEKADLTPEIGVVREVKEELGLDVQQLTFIGHYEFARKNQLLIAYHAQASGEIRLNEELVEYRRVRPADLQPWAAGTGYAVRDWMLSKGLAAPEPATWEQILARQAQPG